MKSKFFKTVLTCFSNLLAYRLNLLLLVIGPALVFFLIKWQLWSSIFNGNSLNSIHNFSTHESNHSIINGYTLTTMLNYQFWVFLLGLLTQGFNSIHIADDIRLGRITQFLLYPYSFFHYNTAYFTAFFFIQLCICSLTFIIVFSSGLLPFNPIQLVMGLLFSILVAWFWFQMQYIIGILAFWLDETWVMRVLVGLIAQFLSGSILPLEFYPKWVVNILTYSPFPYITYFPVKLMMAEHLEQFNIIQAVTILSFWSLLLFLLTSYVWRKGIKLYTAAGM